MVRRASRRDAHEIGAIHVKATRFAYGGIYSDAYLEGLSPAARAEKWIEEGKGALAVDDPDMAVFVACAGAPIVGFGCAGRSEIEECAAELFALYLDPPFIGKGVGRSLFEACIAHAKERGFGEMTTSVLTKNVIARRFYERMQGRLLPDTEKLIETGGTIQAVITYCWAVH